MNTSLLKFDFRPKMLSPDYIPIICALHNKEAEETLDPCPPLQILVLKHVDESCIMCGLLNALLKI